MTAVDIYHAIEQDDRTGQIITRYWGYTRIVRQTISPAWHERTLVCCLKTYIMYQPMREPRRLAPTLGILAFGLQAAVGLTPSDYAIEQSKEQISGKASYAEVEHRLREYHSADSEEAEHFEADIVSTRISSLLQTESFVFAPPMLRQIHRHLFDGVFKNDWVGQWRQVNLTKKEPVLQGDSVSYAPFHLIGEMLDYDFGQEKGRQATYPQIGRHEIASSAFGFISGVWQIHPFREGNTRTTAVFAITDTSDSLDS